MLGLLEWNTGGTFVDGVNIKDIPYNQLWQKIGYVPQAKASAFAYSTQEMVILGRNAHLGTFRPVSYTHLDVYKRQPMPFSCIRGISF